MLASVSDSLRRDITIPCSRLVQSIGYFSDVLGFSIDEQSSTGARLLRDGYAVHLLEADAGQAAQNFTLLLDIKALDAAWSHDREATEDDCHPPALNEEQQYVYRTLDPSGNDLTLKAGIYRGRRKRRSRGETRRIRPRSSDDAATTEP